jgi:hypothetical protein
LDYRDKFKQAYPMTFENVGLSEDGFEFIPDDNSRIITDKYFKQYDEFTTEIILEVPETHPFSYAIAVSDMFPFASGGSYGIAHNTNGRIYYGVRESNNTNYTYVLSNILQSGIDVHIVCTYCSDKIEMYINGLSVGSSELITNRMEISTPLCIGADINGSIWNGFIKSCSFYSKILTAQEVLDRYNEVTFNVE